GEQLPQLCDRPTNGYSDQSLDGVPPCRQTAGSSAAWDRDAGPFLSEVRIGSLQGLRRLFQRGGVADREELSAVSYGSRLWIRREILAAESGARDSLPHDQEPLGHLCQTRRPPQEGPLDEIYRDSWVR